MKWAGHVERMGDKKSKKMCKCPESGGKKEAGKTENEVGGLG